MRWLQIAMITTAISLTLVQAHSTGLNWARHEKILAWYQNPTGTELQGTKGEYADYIRSYPADFPLTSCDIKSQYIVRFLKLFGDSAEPNLNWIGSMNAINEIDIKHKTEEIIVFCSAAESQGRCPESKDFMTLEFQSYPPDTIRQAIAKSIPPNCHGQQCEQRIRFLRSGVLPSEDQELGHIQALNRGFGEQIAQHLTLLNSFLVIRDNCQEAIRLTNLSDDNFFKDLAVRNLRTPGIQETRQQMAEKNTGIKRN